jgi:hypothetical protein
MSRRILNSVTLSLRHYEAATLTGIAGHTWIANVAAPGLCGKCRTSLDSATARPQQRTRFPPQPTQKEAPHPSPGEILRSLPAHCDLVLDQPPPRRDRQGWLHRERRASPEPIGAPTFLNFEVNFWCLHSFLFLGSEIFINVYRVGTLKNRPLDEAPRPKVNKLESEI